MTTRRDFVRLSSGAAAALGLGAVRLDPFAGGGHRWHPLRRAPEIAADGHTLVAAAGTADIGGGTMSPAWMIDGSLPSPLIRLRKGDDFRMSLHNQLQDNLILHWHGLTPPETSDGHPRFAIPWNKQYHYRFPVENRAGTYWYHSHTHMMTAKHTARGIGGMILVEDDQERALGLPSGPYEVPIVLQDRVFDRDGELMYQDPNLMAGHTGPEPFGNGIHRPYLDVDRALYRLRLLNGSNARIFRLEWSDGRPIVMIGNDGGLIARPLELPVIDLAPAERLDLLVDLSGKREGDVLTLRSQAYQMGAGMDIIPGVSDQGARMELLQLRVGSGAGPAEPIPTFLSAPELPDPAAAVRERTIKLGTDSDPESRGIHIRHRMDGRLFDMSRVDYRIPFGQTEIWTFSNDRMFAHPIHLHGTHFKVLSRTGGRGRVMPWEEGAKDTVLLHPDETVKIAVRYSAHPGLFMIHCHNLEHEDVGMMANVRVE